MREQTTKAQVKEKQKQKLQDNTHPLSPLPHQSLAGTMYLIEGQFNIWWPSFSRQEECQMTTKATVLDIVQP